VPTVQLKHTAIDGLIEVEATLHEDERGVFARTYDEQIFGGAGLPTHWPQCNTSWNRRRGTLRGMHFQYPPHAETKLVRATRGAILDVIVDLRPESPTFLESIAVHLSADDHRALYVPERFAHGYQALEDGTETSYQAGEFYAPGSEGGLSPLDPRLALKWPLPVTIISAKDSAWKRLEEIELEVKRRMRA